MKRCRVTGATLVVAKLDRLSRNVAFLMTLRDSGVEFVAADLPEANTMNGEYAEAVAVLSCFDSADALRVMTLAELAETYVAWGREEEVRGFARRGNDTR